MNAAHPYFILFLFVEYKRLIIEKKNVFLKYFFVTGDILTSYFGQGENALLSTSGKGKTYYCGQGQRILLPISLKDKTCYFLLLSEEKIAYFLLRSRPELVTSYFGQEQNTRDAERKGESVNKMQGQDEMFKKSRYSKARYGSKVGMRRGIYKRQGGKAEQGIKQGRAHTASSSPGQLFILPQRSVDK